MHKITLLYAHPANPDAFEKYYAEKHLSLAAKMKAVSPLELTKLLATPDGGKPSSYRMAELYFSSQSEMEKTMSSPEGKAAAGDLSNFATGGVTMMIGTIQS